MVPRTFPFEAHVAAVVAVDIVGVVVGSRRRR